VVEGDHNRRYRTLHHRLYDERLGRIGRCEIPVLDSHAMRHLKKLLAALLLTTLCVASPAYAAITQDTVNSGFTAAGGLGATVSVAHTCAAGSTILIAQVAVNDGNQHAQQTNSVTTNGVSLTQLVKADSAADTRAEIWYLMAPDTGVSENTVITYDNNNYVGLAVYCLGGTSTAAPTITTSLTGTASSVTNNITTTVANSWVMDTLSDETNPTAGGSQTSDWNNTNQGFQWGQGSHITSLPAAGSQTLSWSNTSGNTWSYVQAVVSPPVVPAGPATVTIKGRVTCKGSVTFK
jgi:hypothetical protein